jgi:mono/diheme cytochrome c family protein
MSATSGNRKWILPGTLLTGAMLVTLGCCIFVKCGWVPVNADAGPAAVETWIAQAVLDATIDTRASGLRNPLPASSRTIDTGMHLYKQNCQVCHGGANARASAVAQGLYQKPPQFGDGSMSDDPENTTYWKIAHGIRFTGMPAFDASLTSKQMWQITTFLHHIGALPRDVATRWRTQ